MRSVGSDEHLQRTLDLVQHGMKLVRRDHELSKYTSPFHTFHDGFHSRGIFCRCGIIGSFFCTSRYQSSLVSQPPSSFFLMGVFSRTCRNTGIGHWDGPFDFAGHRHGQARASRAICAVCFGKLGTTYCGIEWGPSLGGEGDYSYNIEQVPDYFTNRPKVDYHSQPASGVPMDMRTAHCKDCMKVEKR